MSGPKTDNKKNSTGKISLNKEFEFSKKDIKQNEGTEFTRL